MTNEKQIVLDFIAACISAEGYIRGPYRKEEEQNTTIAYGPYSDKTFSHNELMMIKSTLKVLVASTEKLLEEHNKKFSFDVDPEKFKAALKKRTFIP
jgi:hypothetical protein